MTTSISQGVEYRPDIVYGSARDHTGRRQRLELDLWLPPESGTRRPAVILAHGGGFYRGHRKMRRIRALAESIAERGYVTASVTYRLSPTRPRRPRGGMGLIHSPEARDAQHDLQAAVRFLRSEARALKVDRRRIAFLGTSAGGIAALRAAYRPFDAGRSGHRRYRSTVSAVVSLWGAADRRMVPRNAPPVLMFHGRRDKVVRFHLARQTCATTRHRGSTCRKRWWGREGHSPWHRTDEIVRKTVRFLDQQLA
ncbi:carboxylesterase family protein [Nocardioides panacisoli]|uniref:alpha/beta hydrolase n=1 Tax=Nocardioides panacisoli TaxID=627624 RepID=UPI001C638096|nr:dienelactone hydrolase family protein [Nocardioides panacisoli]QYJ02591.1 carboxylesterase family protein [Nocardioides panacisoli]